MLGTDCARGIILMFQQAKCLGRECGILSKVGLVKLIFIITEKFIICI